MLNTFEIQMAFLDSEDDYGDWNANQSGNKEYDYMDIWALNYSSL